MKRIFSILFALVLAVSLMLVPAASVGASPGPGLVGLWHLDEGSGTTAYDSTVNANDGTISGASWATSANSTFGDALSFDGVNNYVEVPDSTSLDITGEITIEAWVYPKGFQTAFGNNYIVDKYHVYALILRAKSADTGKISGFVWIGETLHQIQTTATIPLNQWSHIAFTRSLTTGMHLYINGEEKTVTAIHGVQNPTGSINDGGVLRIGLYEPSPTPRNQYKGIIDEVRIWNEALSSGEIQESCSLGEARNNDDYDTIVSHEAGSSVFIFTSAFHDVDGDDTIAFRLMRVDSAATINATVDNNGISIRRVTPRGSDWALDGVASGAPADTERDIDPGAPSGPRPHQTLHLDVNLTGGLEPLGFNLHTKGL